MTTLASSKSKRPAGAGTRGALAAILAISAAATLFLFWLIYMHPASDSSGSAHELSSAAERHPQRRQRGLAAGRVHVSSAPGKLPPTGAR